MSINRKWVRHPPKDVVGQGGWININESGNAFHPNYLTYKKGDIGGQHFVQMENGATGSYYKEWWQHPPQEIMDWIIPVSATRPEEAPTIPVNETNPYQSKYYFWMVQYTKMTIDGQKQAIMSVWWDPPSFVSAFHGILKIHTALKKANIEVEPLESMIPDMEILSQIPVHYLKQLPVEFLERIPIHFLQEKEKKE